MDYTDFPLSTYCAVPLSGTKGTLSVPRSSSGPGHLVLIQKIRGSTPLRGTTSQLNFRLTNIRNSGSSPASVGCSSSEKMRENFFGKGTKY